MEKKCKGAAEVDINAVFGSFAQDMNMGVQPQFNTPAPQAPVQQQYLAPQQQQQAPAWPPQGQAVAINPMTGQPY